jgi:UDP-N-acetylmuramyl pentapeptide phosphotransferase/UDP-N-acetylglucosamine-1-phosphate transferase
MTAEIFTIDREQVERLNDLFHKIEASKAAKSVAASGVALAVGGAIATAGAAQAQVGPAGGAAGDASAAAAASIASGVTNAINMIKAIDGIGLAAFGVALAPMGFMVTLRVLNMVLSRV